MFVYFLIYIQQNDIKISHVNVRCSNFGVKQVADGVLSEVVIRPTRQRLWWLFCKLPFRVSVMLIVSQLTECAHGWNKINVCKITAASSLYKVLGD